MTSHARILVVDDDELVRRALVERLRADGYDFDRVYTSVLKRAIRTAWLAMEEMDRMWLPVVPDWRLNEPRIYYGTWSLTGRHAKRRLLPQPDPELRARVVGDYERALAAAR